jgi:hypothetical protein
MAKKMKSPEKSLPSEMAAGSSSGNAPDIQVPEGGTSTASSEGAAPTLTPPSQSSAGNTAFGAAVWATDKRVNGLYNTQDARNSWMSIAGTGWVKLATASDSACEAMTVLAAHARLKNCRIDYAVDANLTTEIYVW